MIPITFNVVYDPHLNCCDRFSRFLTTANTVRPDPTLTKPCYIENDKLP